MYVQLIKPIKWLTLLLLGSMISTAYALNSDVEKPVQIEADEAIFDKAAGTATYNGNVVIRQGTLEIFASHIQINAPGNEIQNIVASGNPVSLKQTMENGKLAQGQAAEMQYFVKDKRLIFNGNAKLTQDKDMFASNHIEYLPDSGQLIAGSKGSTSKTGRVSATFYPTNKAAP